MDPLASFFSSNSLYKPFGTFLFCTDSGGHTAFEDEILILEVLDAMASSNPRSFQLLDYRNELGSIRRKILYRGDSIFGEWYSNPLMAGVVTQFQDINVLDDISHGLIARSENI
ncbi:unnamed protein product [Lactuca saligna]|uniref:Uncharacterized protein n=1 Tax=Lactuca saligna TaxID=75948 RepID=A0AA35Y6Q7_LACSI|nr:unnamed protein product [Lactuca saligna]